MTRPVHPPPVAGSPGCCWLIGSLLGKNCHPPHSDKARQWAVTPLLCWGLPWPVTELTWEHKISASLPGGGKTLWHNHTPRPLWGQIKTKMQLNNWPLFFPCPMLFPSLPYRFLIRALPRGKKKKKALFQACFLGTWLMQPPFPHPTSLYCPLLYCAS